MSWERDLEEGESLLAAGNFEEAYRIGEKLNRNREIYPSPRMFIFLFHAACGVRAIAHADALAHRLRSWKGDKERFTSASWFQSLAGEAWTEGRTADAIALLYECLVTAPNHRELFLADPRIEGLVPLFLEHERTTDQTVPKPPPPKADPGPMPPLAKKALKRAKEFTKQGKYREAWDAIGRLRVNDFHRSESILAAFPVAIALGFDDIVIGLGSLMQRGSREERKIIAEFYRSQAQLALSQAKVEIAVNTLHHAMSGMADMRDYFAEDPRLAKLLERI